MKWIMQKGRRNPSPNSGVRIVSHLLNPAQLAQLWGKAPTQTQQRVSVQVSHEQGRESSRKGHREWSRKVTTITEESVTNW